MYILPRICIILTIILLNVKFIYAQSTRFELNGLITGKYIKGQVFLTYSDINRRQIIDSVQIIDKKFVFNGSITFPTKAYISNNNKFRLDKISSEQIYLEPKKMNVIFDLYDFKTIKVEGSKTQKEYLKLKESKFFNYRKRDSIFILKKNLDNSINVQKIV